MFGKTYIGRFTNIKNQKMSKKTENIVEKDNYETLEDEKFRLRDIVDQSSFAMF